ncbi:MAG: alpha/beta fold hydrolase [Saprospiraceae bacterium]
MQRILTLSFLMVLFISKVHGQVEVKEMGNLYMENIPEIPESLMTDLVNFQGYRDAGLVDWAGARNGLFITTRFAETSQLHYVGHPGAFRKQITFYEEPLSGITLSKNPAHNGFLFFKDVGGSENYQLFFQDLKTGEAKMLSDGTSRNSNVVLSKSGTKYVYASTRKNKKDYGLYLGYLDGRRAEELVLDKEGFWFPIDFAPGDQLLTVRHYLSNFESELYVLDLNDNSLKPISEGEEAAIYSGGVWSKDASRIFITTNYGEEVSQLRAYNVLNGRFINLTDKIPWDIGTLTLSPDGKYLAFQANENGMDRVYVMDTDDYNYFQLKSIPDGVVGNMAWNPDNNLLAISMAKSSNPSDIYVVNTTTQSVNQWTFSETGTLQPENCVPAKQIYYPTFDKEKGKQRTIPAYYYAPENQIGPFPTLIYIHGGPESQFRPGFNPFFQYLVNKLGIAVIAPNVRGSTGYGKSYLMADNGYERMSSVKDIGALIDWITAQPELDEGNIAVMGGSYGGFMVLSTLVNYGDKIKCAVESVGISSFVTFLENTQAYRRDQRRAEYGDERDPKMRKFLEEVSPLTHAAKIKTPLLVVQGLNDPRVPASESEQIVKAVRDNGGDAWYLLAKDEGHGFKKKSNRDFYQATVVMFLEKWLGGK